MRDTYWNGFYPFIDYSSGGSIDGMIKAAEANVAAAGDKTVVIPGHNLPGHASPVSNKRLCDLKQSHSIQTIRTAIAIIQRSCSDSLLTASQMDQVFGSDSQSLADFQMERGLRRRARL